MSKSDNTIAEEVFAPELGEAYQTQFESLVCGMLSALPSNREEYLLNEIKKFNEQCDEDNVEDLKYLATIHVMLDLYQQGWVFDKKGEVLTLRMENDYLGDKDYVRYRMSAECNAQFKQASIKAFIQHMEASKEYNGAIISVKQLIGDPEILLDAIRMHQQVCDPYIQLVTNERDDMTGYYLSEIWRYFRYTWSIPYKTMPGRNLFYLVRDRNQPYHPVMGIFALGNSVLNLTVRDDDIGWTVQAIKNNMDVLTKTDYCEQTVAGTNESIKVKINTPIESKKEYLRRVKKYSEKVMPLLEKNIDDAIDDIYVKDLGYYKQTKYPKQEYIDKLNEMIDGLREKAINNKNNEKNPNWKEEACTNLFRRKRASELTKLLLAKRLFVEAEGDTKEERLRNLLACESGRRAINTALIANRKCKIGSNMMDIIVCGSIPPYNELLGGKLISILACSPTVIRDYTERYANQVSEIASRMKGEKVIRDSHLVYLGTTSLYAVGSSQYNRIKVPTSNGFDIEFRKMGITEGFGTVFFSNETTKLFSKILTIQDGGKRINHVFGEGTSPRFRLINRGFGALGLDGPAFLKHYSPRIVYSINLAKNTNDYLMGLCDKPNYGFNISNNRQVERKTQELIDYWYDRWMSKRLTTVNIEERLNAFSCDNFLLSNKF